MTKTTLQTEAAARLRAALLERGLDLQPESVSMREGELWLVFESGPRCAAIDTASGIWLGSTASGEWRCVGSPCSVSSVAMAVDHLASRLDFSRGRL